MGFAACGRFSEPEFFAPMSNVSATQGDDVAFTCHVRNLGRNSVPAPFLLSLFLTHDSPSVSGGLDQDGAGEAHRLQ